MSEMTLEKMIAAALMPDDELQCLIDARAELTWLRGIEKAVSDYCSPIAPTGYRFMAAELRSNGVGLTLPNVLESIAAALEAK